MTLGEGRELLREIEGADWARHPDFCAEYVTLNRELALCAALAPPDSLLSTQARNKVQNLHRVVKRGSINQQHQNERTSFS